MDCNNNDDLQRQPVVHCRLPVDFHVVNESTGDGI